MLGFRFGAHASLWVHQMESDSEPLPAVTATSPGPARVLDMDRNSLIYIGGLGAHGQVVSENGDSCTCLCAQGNKSVCGVRVPRCCARPHSRDVWAK